MQSPPRTADLPSKPRTFWTLCVRTSYYLSFMVSAAWTALSKGAFGSGLVDFIPRLAIALLIIGAIQWTATLARRRRPGSGEG